jgi:aminoglycoside phosphotransferase (APT) family kinase protein
LGHGDFTYTQLLFDEEMGGLVDFDTVCQAEPSLDLGQFLAYVRIAILKASQKPEHADMALADELGASFLSAYISASGFELKYAERLRIRVPLYEGTSLLRIAIHSWQKLKSGRLEHTLAALEEKISCLPL